MKGKSMKKDELLKNIEKYWTNRAEGYSQVNLEELAGEKWPVWLSVIEEHMPKEQDQVFFQLSYQEPAIR